MEAGNQNSLLPTSKGLARQIEKLKRKEAKQQKVTKLSEWQRVISAFHPDMSAHEQMPPAHESQSQQNMPMNPHVRLDTNSLPSDSLKLQKVSDSQQDPQDIQTVLEGLLKHVK